jgi:hypothetical protein
MRQFSLAALCLLAAVESSWATAVSGSVGFNSQPFGTVGGWTVNFNTGDPAIKLTSVGINFGASGFFIDTATGGFGAPELFGSFPFSPSFLDSLATGFSGPINQPDGATAFTLNFNDFGSGKSFSFGVDVDQCSQFPGQTLGQVIDCSTVTGAELGGSGAFATFTFGGPGYGSYTRTATFVDLPLTGNPFDAIASFSADVPEPSTWVMIGTALAGLGLRRRKRQA